MVSENLLVGKFILQVLPRVEKELAGCHKILDKCPSPFLRRQALASLKSKRFHAQGSGFFQLYGPKKIDILPSLVALQTISDYLDNLCDRTNILDMQAFKTLHLSLEKATGFIKQHQNSYLYYPFQEDGGYLAYLEERCLERLATLPSYQLVQEDILKFIRLYSHLQTIKHTVHKKRKPLLYRWFLLYHPYFPDLYWWEFAAATGSTLGIFVLIAAARDPQLTHREVKSLVQNYFPWICGLHILLDYLIDREEDRREGDLNFTACYADEKMTQARLLLFISRALAAAERLPHPSFHRTVVKGMLALYLSDPKVKEQNMDNLASVLLRKAGSKTVTMNKICRACRRWHII